MKYIILATGKCRDKTLLSLEATYLKRLTPFCPTQVVELPHSTAQTPAQIKQQEAQKQLEKIPQNAFMVALDERGKSFSTRQLATRLQQEADAGRPDAVFVIGGAEGLDDTLRQRADLILSLSALTFPHMFVRPILAEQLYRVATLQAGHPYHRD